MRIKHTFAGIALFLIILCSAFAARANQAVSLNMSEFMQANLIFTGVCTGARAHLQNGLLVTTYTFEVSDVMKGEVPRNFSFTQWGATREGAKELGKAFIYGPPLYEIGKEYTVFLSSESKLGLRAPIGLAQGKFMVVRDAQGKAMVANAFGNKSLFKNLPQTKRMTKALSAGGVQPQAEPTTGPIDYDSFKAMIESLNEKE